MRARVLADPQRLRDLKMIHVAKRQLGMEDDTYRDMLWSVGRARSSGDLDHAGRAAVIDHLKACGFKPTGQRARKSNEWAWVDDAAEGKVKMLRKIIMLARGRNVGKEYVDGMARKMFNVERLEFAAEDQLHSIISALTYDARRRASPRKDS